MTFRVVFNLETGEREEIPLSPAELAALEANVPADEIIILYPVDLWSRLTDSEAVAVETAMTSQPVRIQNIFNYASSYRSDHELWPLLENMATTLFGAERATQILAPS